VPTEENIRAFLLGMADSKTEETIEEGILDGSVATDDLLVIEEELIDDHVFGRLAPNEELAFHASFLINQERRDGLNFSRAMRKYAIEHAPGLRGRQRWWLGRFPRLVLAASLSVSGLAAITVVWLGIRDARLSRELANVSRTSDERQRLLTALEDEQRQRAIADAGKIAAVAPAPAQAAPVAIPAPEPGIQLRPGVRRRVEAIPVLHLRDKAGAVRITLELAFDPQAGLREELLRAGGERIWTQELSSTAQTAGRGETTIYLPAQLLSPGDYQIRLKDLATDASDEGDVYAFRVSRP
jgi:hypothetical protein